MIITAAGAALDGVPIGRTAAWAALARKGMLWSEVQVADVFRVPAGGTGPDLAPRCVEVVCCLRGSLTFMDGGAEVGTLRAGQITALAVDDHPLDCRAGSEGADLLRIRVLGEAARRALPGRTPSLHPPVTIPELP